MTIDIDRFVLSNSLEKHPVNKESIDYKEKYYAVLEYFVLKYSGNEEIANAMLANYRNAFKCNENSSADDLTIKSYAKKVICTKFDLKGFKLFSYRYCLLCDLFMLNAFNNKKIAQRIMDDVKLIFNNRYQKKMERLYSLLYNGTGGEDEFPLVRHQIASWQKNIH